MRPFFSHMCHCPIRLQGLIVALFALRSFGCVDSIQDTVESHVALRVRGMLYSTFVYNNLHYTILTICSPDSKFSYSVFHANQIVYHEPEQGQ